MKRNIDCVGFDATEEMVQFMSESLSELQHMSPYESYVDAAVIKEWDHYLVTIKIKHANGNFSAQVEDKNLEQAIKKSADAIVLQVKNWHTYRFQKVLFS